ncbi:MAG: hypothetical protein NVSMB33_09490 [Ktedonobacteraceae bacterium]
MTSSSKTTTDHNEIRRWAEARAGKPVTVKRTESDDEVSVLRIDFPGYSGTGFFEEITWDEFFASFDEKNLAFLYQEKISSGEESRFFKLVTRDTAEHASHSTTAHSKVIHKAEDKHEPEMHIKNDEIVDKHESETHIKPVHKADKAKDKHESKAHAKNDKAANGHASKTRSKSNKAEGKSEVKVHKSASKGHK